MKKLNAIAVGLATVLALSSGLASAQPLTRAEVRAQAINAQADHTIAAMTGEDSGSGFIAAHSRFNEPRAEVKSELAQARIDGTLDALDRTDSGSDYLARHLKLTEPRAVVKSQLAASEKNGTLDALYGEDSGSFELAAQQRYVAVRQAAR